MSKSISNKQQWLLRYLSKKMHKRIPNGISYKEASAIMATDQRYLALKKEFDVVWKFFGFSSDAFAHNRPVDSRKSNQKGKVAARRKAKKKEKNRVQIEIDSERAE